MKKWSLLEATPMGCCPCSSTRRMAVQLQMTKDIPACKCPPDPNPDVFNRAAQQNVFTEISKPFQTEEQAWQAYKDLIADAAITSSTVYLANPPADTAAVPLPSINGSALREGWLGDGMTDTLPERRALALRLAESLVDATFQAQWSEGSRDTC